MYLGIKEFVHINMFYETLSHFRLLIDCVIKLIKDYINKYKNPNFV